MAAGYFRNCTVLLRKLKSFQKFDQKGTSVRAYIFHFQEFSRSMDQSQPMKDFASNIVAKATVTSSSRSSILRNYSDVSLVDMGEEKTFALTKALGYHVVYG